MDQVRILLVRIFTFLTISERKIEQLRKETATLGNTLEQHIFRVSRRDVEMRERESLMNRRNGGFDSANAAMYATQESESLRRSSHMVSELSSLSQSILGDLSSQRASMKVVNIFSCFHMMKDLMCVFCH